MNETLYTKAVFLASKVDFLKTDAEIERYVIALYNAMIWGGKC